ncbi:MAG: hypothetical protein ACR2JB_18540 [Bryobacteraceae bacterium]
MREHVELRAEMHVDVGWLLIGVRGPTYAEHRLNVVYMDAEHACTVDAFPARGILVGFVERLGYFL